MTRKKKCLICGIERPLDRCHIIPVRVAEGVKGLRKLAKFSTDGKNIVWMCKNHHFLFDTWRFNDQEWEVMIAVIKKKLLSEILTILNSDLKMRFTRDMRMRWMDIDKKRKFARWKSHIGYFLVKYKLLNHHGEETEQTGGQAISNDGHRPIKTTIGI